MSTTQGSTPGLSSNEPSPSKIRAGVKPLNPAALGDSKPRTPPPEPVGDFTGSQDAPPPIPAGIPLHPQQQQAHPKPTIGGPFPMPVGGAMGATNIRSPGGGGGFTPPIAPSPVYPSAQNHHAAAQNMNLPSPSGLTETEFLHTRNLIPHVQHRALVAVMQSLIDDFPTLTPVIRIRCEKAMAFMMSQHPHGTSNGAGGDHHGSSRRDGGGAPPPPPPPHGGYAPAYLPHNNNTGARSSSPPPVDHMGGPTPPGSTKKAARANSNRREHEEQERCGVHGNLRAAKHLQYSLTTQRWECIPGFHCLVSDANGGGSSFGGTPAEGSTPIPGQSPQKAPSPATLNQRRGSNNPPLIINPAEIHDASGSNGLSNSDEKEGGSPQVDLNRLTNLLDELKQ